MSIVRQFASVLDKFRVQCSECDLNQVTPIRNVVKRDIKGKIHEFEDITLNDVLNVTMDIGASTSLGKHLKHLRKGQLDIFVSSREMYYTVGNSSRVVKTTTEVGYVHTDALSSQARLLLGLHY